MHRCADQINRKSKPDDPPCGVISEMLWSESILPGKEGGSGGGGSWCCGGDSWGVTGRTDVRWWVRVSGRVCVAAVQCRFVSFFSWGLRDHLGDLRRDERPFSTVYHKTNRNPNSNNPPHSLNTLDGNSIFILQLINGENYFYGINC